MQRKRGDGGRFFSPKTKDEIAMTLGQVRERCFEKRFSGQAEQKIVTDNNGLLPSHAADGHSAGGGGRDGGPDDQSPVAPLANGVASTCEFCPA